MERPRRLLVLLVLTAAAPGFAAGPDVPPRSMSGQGQRLRAGPGVEVFFRAASPDERVGRAALSEIEREWRDGHVPLLVDLARFLPRPNEAQGEGLEALGDSEGVSSGGAGMGPDDRLPRVHTVTGPRARARERIVKLLEKRTGQRFGHDLRAWRRWMWNQPLEPHPDHALFKAALYGRVDERMAAFFPSSVPAAIRLDEVDWGGVGVNGIPPLDHPKVVRAAAARLDGKDVVFGVAIGGEARAYPRRILGWHEMVRDDVGGVPIALVYCSLCGSAIPYGSEVGGQRFTFGTSGLLYRSNKLMFDEETKSLWSTLEGRPVIGPLVGRGLELRAWPVVTTTWREWVTAHPDTNVLSFETGFDRDYAEGAAYREYFASRKTMFEVPRRDERLAAKAEVLALLLRPGDRQGPRHALALSVELLRNRPVHHVAFAGHELVVLTTPDGANRVYDAGVRRFARLHAPGRVLDERGLEWRVTEDGLVPEGRDEPLARRISARRVFWFGWSAQFPDTTLLR